MKQGYKQLLFWIITASQLLTSCLNPQLKKETAQLPLNYTHEPESNKPLQGGLPARTTAALKDVAIKHNGPFITTQPTYERIAVQSIQFIPHQGFWWAKPTYLSYSNCTKRWKICTSKHLLPVETPTSEPFYAEDMAHAQVTIDYVVEDMHENRPVPTFNPIQVEKTNVTNRPQATYDDQEDNELTPDEIAAIEAAAYNDLIYALQQPHEIEQLLINNQNQLEKFLQQIACEEKIPIIEAEITIFKDYLVQFIQLLQLRQKTIEDSYFGPDTSDYINQHAEKGIQTLAQIEKHLQISEQHLRLLCDMAARNRPDLRLDPLFDIKALLTPLKNKKILLEILNMMLETKVPGGRLMQVILGTVEQPTTWEESLPIAIETTLDFLPKGKAVRFGNLLSGKTTKNEVKKLLIRQAKKQAKNMDQENKQKQQLKAKKAEKEHLLYPSP